MKTLEISTFDEAVKEKVQFTDIDLEIPIEDLRELFTADSYGCCLDEDLQKFAQIELGEDEMKRNQALEFMRQWIYTTDYIKNCRLDSNFLLRFLRSRKFNIPQAQETLVKYISLRQQRSISFQNLSLGDSMVMDLINRGVFFALPQRDKAGFRIIFSIGGNINPHKHTANGILKAIILTLETLLEDEENQIRGFRYILDEGGLGLSHLILFNPKEIASVLQATERSMPTRHKKVEFFNLPKLVGFAFEFIKSLLSPKLKSRINVLKDVGSLIDKDILPAEYGGKIPMAEMIEMFKLEVNSKEKRLLALDKMEIDLDLMKVSTTAAKILTPSPVSKKSPFSFFGKRVVPVTPSNNTGTLKKIEID